MRIVTYLGFTLMSVFIQFSVIDFIQGMLKVEDKPINLKGSSQKRQLGDVLKNISHKPHAIYYRTPKNQRIKHHPPAKLFSNVTLTELFATTDISTTVFEVLYDENSTATDETFTTETLYTSTEMENVTEITLFEQNNETTNPDSVPKNVIHRDCNCNILFGVCDINCCCDIDCLNSEIQLFPNCVQNKSLTKEHDVCVSQLPFFGYTHGLFCIVKINLPEKQDLVVQKIHPASLEHLLTWKSIGKSRILHEFSNKFYKYGDPIWLLKNNSFYHTDLPTSKVNSYCTGRKPIMFLKEEKYSCNVKIGDLEMFPLIKSLEETTVISATPLSLNSSIWNCTTLHCVNWTIIACNISVNSCVNYNKTLHEPQCTESICTNLAFKLEYIFQYYDSKIINASIKFHIQNMTMNIPFISQEIIVKFVLSNQSIDHIINLSGNPGYLEGLPVIVSYSDSNHTDKFYNTSVFTERYFLLPKNYNGVCISSNVSDNLVLFGRNRRIKCRYHHNYISLGNSTDTCKQIQYNITSLLGYSITTVISPLGNPRLLKDEDWVSIEQPTLIAELLYGGFKDINSKLLCYNLVTRYSIIISFANMRGNNRILCCKIEASAKNVTFNIEDISTVVTIDISFIDVTKSSVIEYGKNTPNLNIHLPDDFFYPFRSNESRLQLNVFTMILNCIIVLIVCK